MKKRLLFVLLFFLVNISLASQTDSLKSRNIVLTDASTWKTYDRESPARLLAYAAMFEIEGLVFTTGWSLGQYFLFL
jgi:hypothetical protein